MERREIIFIPSPGITQLVPAVQLAKLITGKDEGSTAAAIGLLLYLQTLRDEQGRDVTELKGLSSRISYPQLCQPCPDKVSSIARDRNSEMYTVGPILDLKGDARIRSCCAQLHEELIAWFTNPYHQSCSPHGQLRGGPEREPGLWSEAGTGFCGPYTSHRPRERERWSTLHWCTQQSEVFVALRVELHTGESLVRGSNCCVAHVLRATVQWVRNALRELGVGIEVKKDYRRDVAGEQDVIVVSLEQIKLLRF
ncbi:hypothetical protein CDL15_Pgr016378 [Punica granatum]|uniref:Uncharacterized protein n=1 Tax=Punica granatum TaxID=22663 RepID=A0A218W6Q4_PUNGR|nr:hypothetical protein CDL15_Pgr016378 [Punica granatum]